MYFLGHVIDFLGKVSNGFIEKAMGGHLGSIMSSMGRWRMRLEVPRAEVAEMLPLARLLSRSTDPVIRSRSKVHFGLWPFICHALFLWLHNIFVGVIYRRQSQITFICFQEFFMQCLNSVGFHAESLRDQLKVLYKVSDLRKMDSQA
jgi:hypothetical protein